MKTLKDLLYNKNYRRNIVLFFIITFCVFLIGEISHFYLFIIDVGDETEYHSNILTMNSILSGFSLTNLGILISISSDQLVEKLKGTDILIKRNTLISHSICFGAISIMASLLFVLNINMPIASHLIDMFYNYLFTVEISSLFLSILFFLLSIKKMIELLTYIYIPKKQYTCDKIERIQEQMRNSVKVDNTENDE